MIDISVWAGADVTTTDDVVARVQAAADDGFRAIWAPQTTALDTLTALALAARVVPHIRLGTAVVPIQGRHPIPLALQALTVADVAGPERFTLGVGVSHALVSEGWFGMPYRDMVRLCADELHALSELLSPTRRADVVGDTLTARVTIPMTVAPPGLVLAALGPRMLDLAGQFTDGTVTWMTGVHTLTHQVVPRLRAAAERAGRRAPRVIAGLPVCLTDDSDAARTRVDTAMAGAAQMPSYRRMLAAEGAGRPSDIALIGHQDQLRDAIARLEDAGTTELLANIMGTDDEKARTRAFLAACR